MTVLSFSTESSRMMIERRLRAGHKKFARRYASRGRWGLCASLLERAIERDEEDVMAVRKLADCHRRAGHKDRFEVFIQKAIQIDLQRLARAPNSTATHRSLARSYRLAKNREQATFHLEASLKLTAYRVEQEPRNIRALFALGQTLSLLHRHRAALEAYRRILEIDPGYGKAQKAVYLTERRIQEAAAKSRGD